MRWVVAIALCLSPLLSRAQTPAPQHRVHDSATVTRLYDFIRDWWRTDYRYGGTSKNGIDCSAFTRALYSRVYSKPLPRTASQQHAATSRVRRDSLMPGDLVFFRHKPKGRTSGWHVGVYITGGFFVHSGSGVGVFINNIEEPRYRKIYYGAGRVSK